MSKSVSKRISLGLFCLISLGLYAYLGYGVERQAFWTYFGVYAILFLGYACLVFGAKNKAGYFGLLLGAGFAFRLILLAQAPNLSDDYFRYIWDGRLLVNGYNPFLYLPNELTETPVFGQLAPLYDQLNSAQYFTVYPPVMQAVFGLAVSLAPSSLMGSLVVLHLLYLLAESLTIYGLYKLLKRLNLPLWNLLIYVFNPLIIIELSGNLHTEQFMLLGLVWAFYFLIDRRWLAAALGLIVAVAAKLLPLMFLPLIWRYLGWKRGFYCCLVVGLGVLACFAPFWDMAILIKMGSSVGLYFRSFEFNASLYYFLRWGLFSEQYWLVTWVRVGLPLVVLGVIAFRLMTWDSKAPKTALFYGLFWTFVAYYVCATTVHPWYLTTLVLFAAFLPYRFVLWWSFLVSLSYITYQTTAYLENMYLIALEYLIVYGCLVYEYKKFANNKVE